MNFSHDLSAPFNARACDFVTYYVPELAREDLDRRIACRVYRDAQWLEDRRFANDTPEAVRGKHSPEEWLALSPGERVRYHYTRNAAYRVKLLERRRAEHAEGVARAKARHVGAHERYAAKQAELAEFLATRALILDESELVA